MQHHGSRPGTPARYAGTTAYACSAEGALTVAAATSTGCAANFYEAVADTTCTACPGASTLGAASWTGGVTACTCDLPATLPNGFEGGDTDPCSEGGALALNKSCNIKLTAGFADTNAGTTAYACSAEGALTVAAATSTGCAANFYEAVANKTCTACPGASTLGAASWTGGVTACTCDLPAILPNGFEGGDTDPCSKGGELALNKSCNIKLTAGFADTNAGTTAYACSAEGALTVATATATGCATNFFEAVADTTCIACPGTSASAAAPWTGNATLCSCAQGEYFAAASPSCEACPAGRYEDDNFTKTVQCKACTGGQYSDAGEAQTTSSVCKACAGGRYSDAGEAQTSITTCTACIGGKFSDAGEAQTASSVCKACAGGQYSDAGNAQTSNSTCKACIGGRYSDAGEAQTSKTTCTACAVGKYSDSGEAQTNSSVCEPCGKGKYMNESFTGRASETDCLNCPKGKYSQSEGLFGTVGGDGGHEPNCQVCGNGTYQDQTGRSSPSDCRACDAGRFQKFSSQISSASCLACPTGWWQSTARQAVCLACAQGLFSAVEAAVGVSVCQSWSAFPTRLGRGQITDVRVTGAETLHELFSGSSGGGARPALSFNNIRAEFMVAVNGTCQNRVGALGAGIAILPKPWSVSPMNATNDTVSLDITLGTSARPLVDEAFADAALCVRLKQGPRDVFVDTGIRMQLDQPTLVVHDANMPLDKIMVGHRRGLTLAGFGLGENVTLGLVPVASTCADYDNATSNVGLFSEMLGSSSLNTSSDLREKVHTRGSVEVMITKSKFAALLPPSVAQDAQLKWCTSDSYTSPWTFYETGVNVTVVNVKAVSPSQLFLNGPTNLTFPGSIGLSSEDSIMIVESDDAACLGNLVLGGDVRQLASFGGIFLPLRLGREITSARVCLKVQGAPAFVDSGLRITVQKPRILTATPPIALKSQSQLYTLSGLSLHDSMEIRIVASISGSSCNDDNAVLPGGAARKITLNTDNTASVSFTLAQADTGAKLCFRVPSALGGDGVFNSSTSTFRDTGLTIQVVQLDSIPLSTIGMGIAIPKFMFEFSGLAFPENSTRLVVKMGRANDAANGCTAGDHFAGIADPIVNLGALTGTLPAITNGTNAGSGPSTNPTGGSGNGLAATVHVADATSLSAITVIASGSGYKEGDVLAFPAEAGHDAFVYTLVAGDFQAQTYRPVPAGGNASQLELTPAKEIFRPIQMGVLGEAFRICVRTVYNSDLTATLHPFLDTNITLRVVAPRVVDLRNNEAGSGPFKTLRNATTTFYAFGTALSNNVRIKIVNASNNSSRVCGERGNDDAEMALPGGSGRALTSTVHDPQDADEDRAEVTFTLDFRTDELLPLVQACVLVPVSHGGTGNYTALRSPILMVSDMWAMDPPVVAPYVAFTLRAVGVTGLGPDDYLKITDSSNSCGGADSGTNAIGNLNKGQFIFETDTGTGAVTIPGITLTEETPGATDAMLCVRINGIGAYRPLNYEKVRLKVKPAQLNSVDLIRVAWNEPREYVVAGWGLNKSVLVAAAEVPSDASMQNRSQSLCPRVTVGVPIGSTAIAGDGTNGIALTDFNAQTTSAKFSTTARPSVSSRFEICVKMAGSGTFLPMPAQLGGSRHFVSVARIAKSTQKHSVAPSSGFAHLVRLHARRERSVVWQDAFGLRELNASSGEGGSSTAGLQDVVLRVTDDCTNVMSTTGAWATVEEKDTVLSSKLSIPTAGTNYRLCLSVDGNATGSTFGDQFIAVHAISIASASPSRVAYNVLTTITFTNPSGGLSPDDRFKMVLSGSDCGSTPPFVSSEIVNPTAMANDATRWTVDVKLDGDPQDRTTKTLEWCFQLNGTDFWEKLDQDVKSLIVEPAKVEYIVNASGLPGAEIRIPHNYPNFVIPFVGVGLGGDGIKVKFVKNKTDSCNEKGQDDLLHIVPGGEGEILINSNAARAKANIAITLMGESGLICTLVPTNLGGSGWYERSNMVFTLARITEFSPTRVYRNINVSFSFIGEALASSDIIKIGSSTDGCDGNHSVTDAGGNAVSLSGEDQASFRLTRVGRDKRVCYGTQGLFGIFADSDFRVDVVQLTELYPLTFGYNVSTKLRFLGDYLSDNVALNDHDEIRIALGAEGGCSGTNNDAVGGTAFPLKNHSASLRLTTKAAATAADKHRVCIKVRNGTDSWVDTGFSVSVVEPTIERLWVAGAESATGSRDNQTFRVLFNTTETFSRVRGFGLSPSTVDVQWNTVTPSDFACTSALARTGASHSSTLNEINVYATAGTLAVSFQEGGTFGACVSTPVLYGSDSAEYKPTAFRIESARIDAVHPTIIGINVPTTLTLTGAAVQRDDFVKIGTPESGCAGWDHDGIVVGGNGTKVTGVTGVTKGKVQATFTLSGSAARSLHVAGALVCLRLPSSREYRPCPGVTIDIKVPAVQTFAVDRIARGEKPHVGGESTVTITGYGLATNALGDGEKSMSLRIVHQHENCSSDSGVLTGVDKTGFQLQGPDDTRLQAMVQFSEFITQESAAAQICVKVPQLYGGTGRWGATGLSLDVAWLTRISPSRIHLNSSNTLSIQGVGLAAADDIWLVPEGTTCTDDNALEHASAVVLDDNSSAVFSDYIPLTLGKHKVCYRVAKRSKVHDIFKGEVEVVELSDVLLASGSVGRNVATMIDWKGNGLKSEDRVKFSENGAGDCNQDPLRPDVLVTFNNNANGWIRLQNERGNLSQATENDTAATVGSSIPRGAVSLADLNGDGLLDMVMGNRGDGDSSKLTWFLNQGKNVEDAVLRPHHLWNDAFDNITAGLEWVPLLVDLNRDNVTDLLVFDINEAPNYFENQGTVVAPDFATSKQDSPLVDPDGEQVKARTSAVVDVDADGDLDLFMVNNKGALQIWLQQDYTVNPFTCVCGCNSLNKKCGQPSSDIFSVVGEDGTTELDLESTYGGDSKFFSLAFADVDADGLEDMLVGRMAAENEPLLHLYLRKSTRLFQKVSGGRIIPEILSDENNLLAYPAFLVRDDFGGRDKPLGLGMQTEYRLRRDVKNSVVCIQLDGSGPFLPTGVRVNVQPPRVTTVTSPQRIAFGQTITLAVDGVGLNLDMLVKLVPTDAGCFAAAAPGCEPRGLVGINDGASSANVSFMPSSVSGDRSFTMCWKVPARYYGGSDVFTIADPRPQSQQFTMAFIENVSIAHAAPNITYKIRVVGKGLGNEDAVVFSHNGGDCPTKKSLPAPQALGGSSLTALQGDQVDIDVHFPALGNATVCLLVNVGGAHRVYQKMRDNSGAEISVQISPPRIDSMTPTRVVKGHLFTLRFEGMGLGSHVAVKIVRTKDTCRDGSPVAGGQEIPLEVVPATVFDGNLVALGNFTVMEPVHDGKVCTRVLSRNGGSGVFIHAFNLTVVEVTNFRPAILGKDITTMVSIDQIGLLGTDNVVLVRKGTPGCTDILVGAEAFQVTVMKGGGNIALTIAEVANADICVQLNGGGAAMVEGSEYLKTDAQVDVQVQSSALLAVSGPKYVPFGAAATYNITGTGVHDENRFKWVLGSAENCAAGGDNPSAFALPGGEGFSSFYAISADATLGSVAFTFAAPTLEAFGCLRLPLPVETGEKGKYSYFPVAQNTASINVVKVDTISPQVIGTNVTTELSLSGTLLEGADIYIKLVQPDYSCPEGGRDNADGIVAGGHGTKVAQKDGAFVVSFTVAMLVTEAKVCVRVGAVIAYEDTNLTLTVTVPRASHFQLPGGADRITLGEIIGTGTGLQISEVVIFGTGLHKDLRFQLIKSGASRGCRNATTYPGGGGDGGLALKEGAIFSNATTGKIHFKDPIGDDAFGGDDGAIICMLTPVTFGGSGVWEDTTLRLAVSWVEEVHPYRVHADRSTKINLQGTGLRTGDLIKVVPNAAKTCNIDVATKFEVSSPSGGDDASVTVQMPDIGIFKLCYRRKDEEINGIREDNFVEITGGGDGASNPLASPFSSRSNKIEVVAVTSTTPGVAGDGVSFAYSVTGLLREGDRLKPAPDGDLGCEHPAAHDLLITNNKGNPPTRIKITKNGTQFEEAAVTTPSTFNGRHVSCYTPPSAGSNVTCVVASSAGPFDNIMQIVDEGNGNDAAAVVFEVVSHGALTGNADTAVALGDVNFDGKVDVLHLNETEVNLFLSTPTDSGIGNSLAISLMDRPAEVQLTPAFVDLDDDSLLDLVVGLKGGMWWYKNIGTLRSPDWSGQPHKSAFDSCFKESDDNWPSLVHVAPAFYDIDGNGHVDFVATVGDKLIICKGQAAEKEDAATMPHKYVLDTSIVPPWSISYEFARPTFFLRDGSVGMRDVALSKSPSHASTSRFEVEFTLHSLMDRRVCLRLQGDAYYFPITLGRIDVEPPMLNEMVHVPKIVRNQTITFHARGSGLTTGIVIRLVKGGPENCRSGDVIDGGESKPLRNISRDTSSAYVDFVVVEEGVDSFSVCYKHATASSMWESLSAKNLVHLVEISAAENAFYPKKVGREVSTTVAIEGTGFQYGDVIRIVKASSSCETNDATGVVDGGERIGLNETSGAGKKATLILFLREDAIDAKVCVQAKGNGIFVDTQHQLTVLTSSIRVVHEARVMASDVIPTTFTLEGFGLSDRMFVKLEKEKCSAGGNNVDGGGATSLQNIDPSATTATLSYTIPSTGTVSMCLCVKNCEGEGEWVTQHQVTFVNVNSISPTTVALGVEFEMTLTHDHLNPGDRLRIVKDSCSNKTSLVQGVAETTVSDDGIVKFTLEEYVQRAQVCLHVANGTDDLFLPVKDAFINVSHVGITSLNLKRMVRGSTVEVTVHGYGLGEHVYVRAVADTGHPDVCSNKPTVSALNAQRTFDPLSLASKDTKVARFNLTIVESGIAHARHRLCYAVSKNFGDTWKRQGEQQFDEDTVTNTQFVPLGDESNQELGIISVVDIARVAPLRLGLNVPTEVTITMNDASFGALHETDSLKFVVAKHGDGGDPCGSGSVLGIVLDGAEEGTGSEFQFKTSSEANYTISEALPNSRGNLTLCLRLGGEDHSKSHAWHPIPGISAGTLQTIVPALTSVTPNRVVVKQNKVVYSLTGHGINSDMQMIVVHGGPSNCNNSDSIILGGSANNIDQNSLSPDRTVATVTFTLDTQSANGALCYSPIEIHGGQTGRFLQGNGVGPIVVISLTQFTPGTMCLGNKFKRVQIQGNQLGYHDRKTFRDKIRVMQKGAQCDDGESSAIAGGENLEVKYSASDGELYLGDVEFTQEAITEGSFYPEWPR